MMLDLEADGVDRGDRVGAIAEPLGDVFQTDLGHVPNGSLPPMDESTPADTAPEEFTPSSPEIEAEVEVETQAEVAVEAASPNAKLDLDGIERDLADVEVALARLDAGTYWTDEVSGGALPAELLEQHPTARRA